MLLWWFSHKAVAFIGWHIYKVLVLSFLFIVAFTSSPCNVTVYINRICRVLDCNNGILAEYLLDICGISLGSITDKELFSLQGNTVFPFVEFAQGLSQRSVTLFVTITGISISIGKKIYLMVHGGGDARSNGFSCIADTKSQYLFSRILFLPFFCSSSYFRKEITA